MTTQELKNYISKVVGNSIRCLLPSYWWKRVFNLILDKISILDTLSIDDKVSDTSTNPVQNKVIKAYTDVPVVEIEGGYNYINPNIYYKVTNSGTWLSLNFSTSPSTIVHNYMVEFTVGESLTLYLPEDIKWANGVIPTLESGKTYQLSIINNLAVITSFYE